MKRLVFLLLLSLLSCYPNVSDSAIQEVNITGNWRWQARDQSKKVVSEGRFEITDTLGNLEGTEVVFIPNKMIPGRENIGGNVTELRFPLKGNRKKYLTKFNVFDKNNQALVNLKLVLSKDGRIMTGKAIQSIRSETPFYNISSPGKGLPPIKKDLGKTIQQEFFWSAIRVR